MRANSFRAISLFVLFSPEVASAAAASCKDVAFTVTASAQNLDLSHLNTTNLTAVAAYIRSNSFSYVPVSGTQTIAGTYCVPVSQNANSTKLQVFFPSITENRDQFSALGGTSLGYTAYEPDMYSWVQYANNLGYATLALDRLGNGKSSHPDPILLVQAPYEVALYHQLVTSIRTGTTSQIPKYNYIIFVGNSYGSQLGSKMAHQYPTDFDISILTGFSMSVLPSLPGVSLQAPVPAAIHDPARFGTLPAGYVTSSIQTARTNSFFGQPPQVSFDPEVAALFYQREDVVSIGQFISTYTIATTSAPEYTKSLLVLTGEEDQAFCGPGSPVLGVAHCGPLLANTKSLFPNAQYSYYSVPLTGHATGLHNSVQQVLHVAHDFLAGKTFAQ